MPLQHGIPTWPGSEGLKIWQTRRMEKGDPVNVSRVDCGVHVGTHVDAPRHFLKDGETIDSFALEVLIGPALVIYLPEVTLVTPRELKQAGIPQATERLLLRTRNSERWAAGCRDFCEDFTAISVAAAQWLVERRIRLVGIDYLSIQPYRDHPGVHETLMRHRMAILEGLELSRVPAGSYELLCLPLMLVGAEGAPARAVLRRPPTATQARTDSGDPV